MTEKLSTANSSTVIVVTKVINLPDGTDLDGNGATIKVENPYVDEGGNIASDYDNFSIFTYTGTVKLSNLVIIGGDMAIRNYSYSDTTYLYMNNVTITRAYRALNINSYTTAILNNCNICRNACDYAGGINCTGKLIMNNCSLSENRSTYSSGGGGAIEVGSSGVLYANNTVISNNSSTEIGGAINLYFGKAFLLNCSVTGNVTTRGEKFGGGIGINGGTLYAVNTILVDNYYYSSSSSSFTRNDISVYRAGESYLYNCLYGELYDTDSVISKSNCKSDTSCLTARAYNDDPIIITYSSRTQSFSHPVLVRAKSSVPSLYVPISTTGCASTGGVDTYFDYSSPSNVKMGYGSSSSITALGGLSAPTAEYKVTDYYENTDRVSGVIGASGTSDKNIYTLTLAESAHGTTSGVSIFSDSYFEGTSVSLQAYAYKGYIFSKWVLVGADTTVSEENPYTFVITENLTITAEYEVVFTLTYDLNGASGSIPSEVCKNGSSVTVTSDTVTYDGYLFIGWNTESDGSGTTYSAGDSITLTSDLTLYAIWLELKTFDVTVEDFEGDYDGKSHSISITISDDVDYTITYGTTSNDYQLTECPSYINAETYVIYFKISAYGYITYTDSATVNINSIDAELIRTPFPIFPITYTGEEQVIIYAGEVSNGTLLYSLDNVTFSQDLPTATDVGTYTVYYKVVGDTNYNDIDGASLEVTISANDKTELSTSLNEANDYYNLIVDDYPEVAEVLETAITNASTVYDNDNVTTEEISDAVAALNTALDNAKASISDYKKVEAVEDLIDAIGEVSFTTGCKDRIDDARAAYDELSADQKELVDNYATLVEAEETYADLVSKSDHEKAEAVEDLIDAIGEVSFTTDCKDRIDEARAAYDALSADQKELVDNYATLVEAEETYADLASKGKTEIADGDNGVSIELTDGTTISENIELKVEVRSSVSEKESEADYAKIKSILAEDEEISKVYDVKLIRIVDGVETEIQPSDIKEGATIKVTMVKPSDITTNDFRLLHIHSANDVEFISDYTLENDELSFNIDRLSEFAFVTKVDTNEGLPGWAIALIIVGAILFTCCLAFSLLFFVFNKWIKDENDEKKALRVFKCGTKEDKVKLLRPSFKLVYREKEEVYKTKKEALDK